MSNEQSNYENVYTGSEVNIQYLQEILHKAGIESIVKNNFESGLRAGFGGGLPGQVQLLVEKSHFSEAQKIVKATFPE
jgi:hypothetical protein